MTPTPPGLSLVDRPSRFFSTIQIYFDDGVLIEYECPAGEASTHVTDIVTYGYKMYGDGTLTQFPPHRIIKVKAVRHQYNLDHKACIIKPARV